MKQKENEVVQSMKAGFTLIEILVVVAILGILGTIAVQQVTGRVAEARITAAEQGVQSLHEACTSYYIKNKKMPTSLDQLCEGENDSILDSDKGLYDPWDNKYEMEVKGKRVVIISIGEDGIKGTEDDIRSDKRKKTSK